MGFNTGASVAGVTDPTLANLAGVSPAIGNTASQATSTTASLATRGVAMLGEAAISAGVSTAIQGGSFTSNLSNDFVKNLAAAGAFQIGESTDPLTLLNIAEHGLLGCAASAAQGNGCAGGAIGAAASAVFSPDFLRAIDPTGAALDVGQRAALAGFATLLGGVTAGLAGQDALAGASAAQNEALNNDAGSDAHTVKAVNSGGLGSAAFAMLCTLMPWLPSNPATQAMGQAVSSTAKGVIAQMQANYGGKTPEADANNQIPGTDDSNTPHSGLAPATTFAMALCMEFTGGIGCAPTMAPITGASSGSTPSTATFSSGDNGAGSGSPTLPGMDRPVRAPNPNYPPDTTVVNAMKSPQIQAMVADTDCGDCSDIASYLYRAAEEKGQVIEVTPATPRALNVYENGVLETGQSYHQVYTDGRYVYDPRASSSPIPKGDWYQSMLKTNPGGVSISVVKGAK